jgi:hypothetical protein
MMKRYRLDPANPPRLVPNKETIEAMQAAERGEVTTVGHPRNLLKSLNADSPYVVINRLPPSRIEWLRQQSRRVAEVFRSHRKPKP